jgi:hypothetical protein
MINLRWLLVPAVLAVLSACGGGGSPSAAPPVSTAPQSSGQKGSAQVTLRFPANFAIAKSAKSTQSKSASATRQKPAYINPSIGYTLTVKINNQTVDDPSTGFTYFTINATNADGSTNVTVPITSNGGTTYQDGALCFSEWDGSNGTGNLVATGCNEAYTDSNGNYQQGTFTIAPATTTAIVLTMQMNATQIAITTDPISGSDATTNTSQPFCVSSGTLVYAFAADPSAGYVYPGTAAGYGGGDPANYYPGIPVVSLATQTIDIWGVNNPNVGKLAATAFGWSFQSDGNSGVIATFQDTNPINYNSVQQTFSIESSSGPDCGG